MSRPRSDKWKWLPPHCYPDRGRIVYKKGGKAVRLCSEAEATYDLVVKRLAEYLENLPDTTKLRWLCEQFNESAHFKKLAASTRKAYGYHYQTIANFEGKNGVLMGDAAFAKVTPGLLRKYLDLRAEQGDPVAGNREVKGYLSAVYAWAGERDMLPKNMVNPCHGVRRNEEEADDRYVEDWELDYALARATPRYVYLFMWLAYLLAARTTEVLQLRRSDLTPEGVRVRRLKGSKTNVVKWSPLLEEIVNEALAPHGRVRSLHLLHDADGQPYRYSALRSAWDRMMGRCAKAAAVDGIDWAPFKRHHLKAKGASDHESGTVGGWRTEQMRNRYRKREDLEEPVR